MNTGYHWKWNTKENWILKLIIILIALFCDFGLKYLPAPTGMSSDAFGVLGIFIGSLLLWLTIGIDWPSILCIFALGMINSFGFKAAFASSFGDTTFIFLMFTFVCTYALSKTPMIKRIALWFVSNKLAKKSGWLFTIMFLLSVLIVGMFMSPTVLFVIMLPILNQILDLAGIKKGEKAGAMLYLGTAFCVSISSGMTPIAHVFPILALKTAGLTVNYLSYMGFAVPVGIICFGFMLLMFRLIMKPNLDKLKNIDTTPLQNELPKISIEEILTSCIFGLVLFLWLTPAICSTDKIINGILIVLTICILFTIAIKNVTKGMKQYCKTNFILGTILVSLLIAGILIFALLKKLGVYDVLTALINSGIGFVTLCSVTLLVVGTFKIAKNILTKNKKMIITHSILTFISLATFILSIIFPTLFSSIVSFIDKCGTAMPPILGTVLLCMISINGKPLATISDSFKNGIPWSSILMCAGTLCLGSALTNETIGLKTYLQTNLTNALSGASAIVLLVIFLLWALLQTNLSSNMVTATLVSSVASTLFVSVTSLNLTTIIALIGMLSAYAFATPPSMPHIAITASSGYTNTTQVLKYGIMMAVISLIVALFVGYPLGAIIL